MSNPAAGWLSDKLTKGEAYPRWLVATGCALVAGAIAAGVVERPSVVNAVLGCLAIAPWGLSFVSRSRVPLMVKVAITLAAAFLIAGDSNNNPALFATIWMVGEVATDDDLPESLLTLAVVVGVLLGHSLTVKASYQAGFLGWMIAAGIAWMVGRVFRHQQVLVSQLRAAQDALAGQAALQERQRIAREIHDVIAHSLTVTLLHLTGARLALKHDRGEAEAALLEAERLGRQSMADIRRTVGLLAAGSDRNGAEAPLPSAGQIPDLVAEYAKAALDVRLQVSGDLSVISLTSGLGLYRIVQESLANVVKHAAGSHVTVSLEVAAGAVRLTVRSRGPELVGGPQSSGADSKNHAGGLGVAGMVERASLLGGTLAAGPDEAGWTVEAVVPLASP
jgi:signal transduction histidine kinase